MQWVPYTGLYCSDIEARKVTMNTYSILHVCCQHDIAYSEVAAHILPMHMWIPHLSTMNVKSGLAKDEEYIDDQRKLVKYNKWWVSA